MMPQKGKALTSFDRGIHGFSGRNFLLRNPLFYLRGVFKSFRNRYDYCKQTGGNGMDLIKIGRYIAGKRKALGLTQMQLAGKLGMSDKSVSKWERGVCLPDVSVYS